VITTAMAVVLSFMGFKKRIKDNLPILGVIYGGLCILSTIVIAFFSMRATAEAGKRGEEETAVQRRREYLESVERDEQNAKEEEEEVPESKDKDMAEVTLTPEMEMMVHNQEIHLEAPTADSIPEQYPSETPFWYCQPLCQGERPSWHAQDTQHARITISESDRSMFNASPSNYRETP